MVVAHSQGTVVANLAMARLANYNDAAVPFVSSMLVGSITASVSKGAWLTRNDDRIVNAARAFLPSIRPGNVQNASSDFDLSRHAFLESYLNGNISGPELLRQIRAQFRPMSYPGYPEETTNPAPDYEVSPHAGESEIGEAAALVSQAVGTAMACVNSGPACAAPPLPTNAVEELVAEIYGAAQACVAGAPGCPAPVDDATSLYHQVTNAVNTAINECRDDLASCEILALDISVIGELVAQVYGVARACLQGAPGCPVEGSPPVD